LMSTIKAYNILLAFVGYLAPNHMIFANKYVDIYTTEK
jgi:hypothetical protein